MATSLPRLTKVSKPMAQAIDQLETYAAIITILIIGWYAGSIESPPEVAMAEFFRLCTWDSSALRRTRCFRSPRIITNRLVVTGPESGSLLFTQRYGGSLDTLCQQIAVHYDGTDTRVAETAIV